MSKFLHLFQIKGGFLLTQKQSGDSLTAVMRFSAFKLSLDDLYSACFLQKLEQEKSSDNLRRKFPLTACWSPAYVTFGAQRFFKCLSFAKFTPAVWKYKKEDFINSNTSFEFENSVVSLSSGHEDTCGTSDSDVHLCCLVCCSTTCHLPCSCQSKCSTPINVSCFRFNNSSPHWSELPSACCVHNMHPPGLYERSCVFRLFI